MRYKILQAERANARAGMVFDATDVSCCWTIAVHASLGVIPVMIGDDATYPPVVSHLQLNGT